jgi:hypothetical protein
VREAVCIPDDVLILAKVVRGEQEKKKEGLAMRVNRLKRSFP